MTIYKTHAEAAVKELQHAAFDRKQLSIVGRDQHTDEHVVGCYNAGDRMKYWGKMGAFWGLLLGSAFFLIPGVGPLLVAGPLVGWIVGALGGAVVVGATIRNHTRQNMNEKVNTLTPWNQLKGMEAFQHGLESLLRRSLVNLTGDRERTVQRVPLVDISEDDQEYLIKAELPEVKKEDVKITMDDGGTLTITGDREFEVNSRRNHRVERTYGCFLHSFLFPDDASPAKVSAEFKDGVLIVHLAKTEKATPQQIKVKFA